MFDFVYRHKRALQLILALIIIPPFALFGVDSYLRERSGTATVHVHVHEVAQLYNSLDPSPFWDRDLDRDAAEPDPVARLEGVNVITLSGTDVGQCGEGRFSDLLHGAREMR